MKKLLVGLLLGASLAANATVYSSTLWEERSQLCKAVAATAEAVAEVGLSKPLLRNINSNPTVKALPKNDQITLFDAVVRADQTRTSWWAFDFCMDRKET